MDTFLKTGNAIYNDDTRIFIGKRIQAHFLDPKKFNAMVDIPGYISEFRKWVQSTKLNSIHGLDSFPYANVTLGVTQAIDEFHYQILLEKRRLRLFRGEYPYHRDVHPFSWETDFIDDYPLSSGDAVAISYPFSGNGNKHPEMNSILDTCFEMKIPVLLDLAWFGTCYDLEFDLSHPAITYACFSLSKGLTCGNYRSGVQFSRSNIQNLRVSDRLTLQQKWNHSIHLNLTIGRELMSHFSPDTQAIKYKKYQKIVCEEQELVPSPCVHIATGNGQKWETFDRDGFCNRINIREAVKQCLKAQKT